MTPDRLDQTTLSQMFLAQMRVALYGGVSSIPVLPTFLKPFGTLHEGTPVAVAEIDDREVRVSLVTFSGGRAEVTDADRFPVPGREYPAPLADLLFAVAELAQPPADRAAGSRPLSPLPHRLRLAGRRRHPFLPRHHDGERLCPNARPGRPEGRMEEPERDALAHDAGEPARRRPAGRRGLASRPETLCEPDLGQRL